MSLSLSILIWYTPENCADNVFAQKILNWFGELSNTTGKVSKLLSIDFINDDESNDERDEDESEKNDNNPFEPVKWVLLLKNSFKLFIK